MVATDVLLNFLGLEWLKVHVLAEEGPTDFFKNANDTFDQKIAHTFRVIHLAEMLLNLQPVPGFSFVLSGLKGGEIESRFAELEIAKLMFFYRVPFRFMPPSERGHSYDLELKWGDEIVATDTKCKYEKTPRGVQTVVSTLVKSRDQLPKDKPGFFFHKASSVMESYRIRRIALR